MTRLTAPLAVLVLTVGPAWAHPPPLGIGGFGGGLLHPLFVPAHLFALLALGLLIGQQARWTWMAAFSFVLGLAGGLGVLMLGVVPRLMNNAAASHVSMSFDLQGPSYTVATACASSNHAMGQAMGLIRAGLADVVLTGGSESMLCFGGIKAWEGLRVMSKDGCRPFSKNRNGMVQGEGAAVFVFEELEHARARGAAILAEVTGFAMTSDASDIVTPNLGGAVRAMRGALA